MQSRNRLRRAFGSHCLQGEEEDRIEAQFQQFIAGVNRVRGAALVEFVDERPYLLRDLRRTVPVRWYSSSAVMEPESSNLVKSR